MDTIMQAGDELAALLARNLTLQQVQPLHAQQDQSKAHEGETSYSASQHYIHTAHITQPEPIQEPQRRSSEPPQTEPSAASTLMLYGVDHTALSASQMELFKTADDTQKMRLIELWKICPPGRAQDNPAITWSSTSVEQEEQLAQLRFQRKLAEDEQSTMSLDGTPMTPVRTDEGHWITTSSSEPYMASGYEMLAQQGYEESVKQFDETMAPGTAHLESAATVPTYRPATDPVYNTLSSQRQPMENQYEPYWISDDMEL